jgi:hypothetical protein
MIFDINQLAPAVSVMSIAIIGVSVLMIAASWKGLERSYLSLSTPLWHASKRASLVAFSLIFILMGATTVTGVYASTMTVAVYFWVIIIITAIVMLLIIVASILRKSKKFRRPHPPDMVCSMYHFSLLLNVTGILCNIVLLVGITTSMINMKIGSIRIGNMELARWLVLDGVICFVFVICATGMAYFLGKSNQLKTVKQQDY